jgi:hypothetical protein
VFSIEECKKIEIPQGAMYLGESTEKRSVGYLELNPHSSLTLHNRIGGIENLIQVEGSCVMIVFSNPSGVNYTLNEGDTLRIDPEGVWHIHCNPFEKKSLTYWYFEGDIRHVIDAIVKGSD